MRTVRLPSWERESCAMRLCEMVAFGMPRGGLASPVHDHKRKGS